MSLFKKLAYLSRMGKVIILKFLKNKESNTFNLKKHIHNKYNIKNLITEKVYIGATNVLIINMKNKDIHKRQFKGIKHDLMLINNSSL